MPRSVKRKVDQKVKVSHGALEKAQLGLKLLKDSVTVLSEENQCGVTNSDCAHYLGLQSDKEGNQQGYLANSIFGLLVKGALTSFKEGR